MEMNDIDILCQSKSACRLKSFLEEKYDYKIIDLYKEDTLNLYKGISIIAQPWSLINKNMQIIQIIRPRYRGSFIGANRQKKDNMFQEAYYSLIKNVDISNCGVFIDNFGGEIKLKESCKDGIAHCLTRTFEINNWSKLFDEHRTMIRENKLTSRGWKNIHNKVYFSFFEDSAISDKQLERKIKITKLELSSDYDYKIWTAEEYSDRKIKKTEDRTVSVIKLL